MADTTDNGSARVPSNDSAEASRKRERRKRKWDQPAEVLVSAGVGVPGVHPVSGVGAFPGIAYPAGIPSVSASLLPSSLVGTTGLVYPVVQQLAHAAVPKPKTQDELIIAREIVINDAESSVRYKLTKRQTQEEIQRCTGAVVITRGKYRPPNAPPDGEKPLYLHISAAAHLKETPERILAVDRAAAMVEEMMKQGSSMQPFVSTTNPPMSIGLKTLSTCVFLGFDPDPSFNIASRIRGPNDQYINHIMNETGATVLLRGRGSGILEKQLSEEGQPPLHILLSSTNPKSLEDAKRLAENLLDTISAEFGATRTSSTKVYGAVPPPQQFLGGLQNTGTEFKVNISSASAMASTPVGILPAQPYYSGTVSHTATAFSQGTVSHSGGISNFGNPQPNLVGCPQPSLTSGTSYSGYEGIYPQATPLQQVALALRQSSSPAISTVSPTTSAISNAPKSTISPNNEKRPPQRRKFQELPISSKDPAIAFQGCGSLMSGDLNTDVGQRNTSNMPAPKKLVQLSSNGMQMPPPKLMPPPPPKFNKSMPPPPPPKSRESLPPPPKFSESTSAVKVNDKVNAPKISSANSVPDTLVKLMEYGDGDDDIEETSHGSFSGNTRGATQKPFWAV